MAKAFQSPVAAASSFHMICFAKQCLIIDVSKPGHLRGLSKFGGVCLSSAMSVLPSDRNCVKCISVLS